MSFLALLALLALSAAEPPPLVIGVFDLSAAGGSGARIDKLLDGLNKMGYRAEAFSDFEPVTMAQYDILYLSDMHNPGNVAADYQERLVQYLTGGGSVLQTWHHHILGQVGVGIQRVYGSSRMQIVPGHPAVEGLKDFNAIFKDHIYEQVGPGAVPLLKDDDGHVVACAGTIGQGKVISCGLSLAIPGGGGITSAPRGPEAELLKQFFAWLRPASTPTERLEAVLSEPRLTVAPTSLQGVVGLDVVVSASLGCPKDVKPEVKADAGRLEDVTPADSEMIHRYRVTVPVTREGQVKHTVTAQVGDVTLVAEYVVEGLTAKAPKDEFRGVWLHVGNDRKPDVVLPELQRLGLNLVIPRIAGGTAAWYASQVQPDVLDPLAPDGDWMAELSKASAATGVRLMPYVNNCVVEGRSKPETLAALRAAGRLQENPQGRPIDWFCPSQESNVDQIVKPMVELVTKYPDYGVSYDFIRYPNENGCFCAKCRARFEQESGQQVADWPKDVLKDGARYQDYLEYRRERISHLVERTSTAIRQANPQAVISAAVFADWPNCRDSIGQDWARWCKEGWLDFVLPMNYTLNPTRFEELTKAHLAAVPPGFPVVEGIGINSGAGRMDAARQVALHIVLARRAGAVGWVGFCYVPKQTSELFTPLIDWLK